MTRKSSRNISDPAAQTEEQPVPASSRVQNIYLSQLVLSPTNVRATPATAAEDAALEASIRANGILQNLIVHPTGIDGRGAYELLVASFDFGCSVKYSVGRVDTRNPRRTPITVGSGCSVNPGRSAVG
jgi:hypothetical protein